MAKLRLTPRAEADLEHIWLYIATDNPGAADAVVERILRKARLAAEHPLIGASRPELGPTARILIDGFYIAIYEPEHDGITLVAVVHARQNPADWL